MSGPIFDMGEVRAFAVDLGEAARVTQREAASIVKRGAQNIKNQMVSEARQSRHFGQIASAVHYDITESGGAIEAEIGYDKGSPGSLANIAVFGTSRGGGTVPDPLGALLDEVPRFEKAVADLAEKNL